MDHGIPYKQSGRLRLWEYDIGGKWYGQLPTPHVCIGCTAANAVSSPYNNWYDHISGKHNPVPISSTPGIEDRNPPYRKMQKDSEYQVV